MAKIMRTDTECIPRIRKITQPHLAVVESCVFTEGIDYFQIARKSLWGEGDRETLQLLGRLGLSGTWLDLASGDGRYACRLLKAVDLLVASDIDTGALSKLWHRTPVRYRGRLELLALNLTEPLPFGTDTFDGILCTGTLHLFRKVMLAGILTEMDRVLRPGGRIILDFATDIERFRSDRTVFKRPGEIGYTKEVALQLLTDFFERYVVHVTEGCFQDDLTHLERYGYMSRGNFLLVLADKE